MLKKSLFLTTIAFLVTSCNNVKVPNIVSEEANYARGILKGKGFEVETTERVEDGVQPGQVLSQEPPAEASTNKGSKINLIIAKSPVYQAEKPVTSNVAVDQETQIKAQKAITEAYKVEADKREQIYSNQKLEIEVLVAEGTITEIEAQERLTLVTREENAKRLQDLKDTQIREAKFREQQAKATIAELNRQIIEAAKEEGIDIGVNTNVVTPDASEISGLAK